MEIEKKGRFDYLGFLFSQYRHSRRYIESVPLGSGTYTKGYS